MMTELVRDYWHFFVLYAPLGVVGVWRWSVWLIQKLISLRYRVVPERSDYRPSLSIITPVYNEDPEVFQASLDSWLQNEPDEIIAVIDYTDTTNIELFKKFQERFSGARLIIEEKSGKRAALHDGILKATSEIIALVDDDTTWEPDIRGKLTAPFFHSRVGAVSPRQEVTYSDSIARRLFSIHLNLRYFLEYPFLAVIGHALHCLSGRTALYRREILRDLAEELTRETFMGAPCISGDDKCLTRLTEERAWETVYQSSAVVKTPGMVSLRDFIRQNIRWARNSWRSDMRMFFSSWLWKREPGLAFFLLDRFLAIFAVWLGPIYFITTLWLRHYRATLIILLWWFLSRAVKLLPHLRYRPRDIVLIPLFVFESYVGSFLKLYALFTVGRQGWITRWSANRLANVRHVLVNDIVAYASVLVVISGIGYWSYMYKRDTFDMYVRMSPDASLLIDTTEDYQVLGYPPQRKIVRYEDGYAVAYRKKVSNVYEPFVAFITQTTDSVSRILGLQEPVAQLPLTQRVASLTTDSLQRLSVVFYGATTGSNENNRQISYSKLSGENMTWSELLDISRVEGYEQSVLWQEHPYMTSRGERSLYVVWEGSDAEHEKQQIKFSYSHDSGVTWSRWVNLNPSKTASRSRPLLLITPDNALHVYAYETSGEKVASIVESVSRDGGATWSTFVTLSDLRYDARHVSGVIDALGVIHIVYRSRIHDGGPSQILYTSNIKGVWSKPRVLISSQAYQLAPSLSVLPNNQLVAVWTENEIAEDFPHERLRDGVIRAAFIRDSLISELPLSFIGSYAGLPEYATTSSVPMVYSVTTATSTEIKLSIVRLAPN